MPGHQTSARTFIPPLLAFNWLVLRSQGGGDGSPNARSLPLQFWGSGFRVYMGSGFPAAHSSDNRRAHTTRYIQHRLQD